MPPLARTGALASGTRTGPFTSRSITDPPAICPPRPAVQGRKPSNAIRAQPATLNPRARRDRKGRRLMSATPRRWATSPQEPPAAFGELTRVHSDEPTIPSGETNAATAIRPDGRSRRAAGMSSRPGHDRAGV